MIRASVIGIAAVAVLAATVSTMTGCDASDSADKPSPTSAETVALANVALSITGADGQHSTGSGILIAPKLVLTAAHLVAGQSKWSITTADGKTANGVRGMTYDWLVYNSQKSHPLKNDVAVIYLDKPIARAAYPQITPTTFEMGKVTRVHGDGTHFTNVDSIAAQPLGFPHAYAVDMPQSELLDTGGAVLDGNNRIVGVVTGQGMTTKALYIARVDGVTNWVTDQTNNCDSGGAPPASTSSSGTPAPTDDGLHVHTYGTPDNSSSSSCSSGSTSNGSSGTTSSGSTSGSTSNGSSGTTSSGSTSNGSSGTTSSGSTSSGGFPGCHGGQNGNCYGDSCTGDNNSSSSSSTSSTSSSGTTGSPTPPAGQQGSVGCGGSGDNPETCPPADSPTCTGPTCGGSPFDDITDYGGCCSAPQGDLGVK
jgi:hypothetical protein